MTPTFAEAVVATAIGLAVLWHCRPPLPPPRTRQVTATLTVSRPSPLPTTRDE